MMKPETEQKYINKIRELEKRVEKLENLQHNREQAETKAYFEGQYSTCPYANECTSGCRGSVHVDDMGRYDHYTDSFIKE